MNSKKLLGNGLLLLAALIWGTAFAFQRAGMDSIEPISFTAARMVLAAGVVGLVAFLTRGRDRKLAASQSEEEQQLCKRHTILGGVSCGVLMTAATLLQQIGIVYTTAGKAGFITAMYMLLVPVIGFLFLKRRNSWLVWLAVLLGVAGMYFLCMSESFSLSRGDFLVLICALLFSFHILCCDYFVRRGNPIRISAIQFATAMVLCTAAALIAETPSWDKIVSALVPILYCGIASGGIGYTLQMVGQKFTDPASASLLMSMESVFAVLGGVILLQERMSSREIFGCIVMFTAIVLVQIPLPGKKEVRAGEEQEETNG